MTSFYLGLALILAITVNARLVAVRVAGMLVAASAMALMAWSIVLADLDGTFAKAPAGSPTPLLLNIEAALITAGVLLLLWTVPRQFGQPASDVPPRSTPAAYGHVTRGLHWASATLVIATFVMGQFVAVLTPDRPERAEFLATHMSIGGAIFLLTLARLIERLFRQAPPAAFAARAGQFGLYCLLIATSLTGLALATAPVPLLGLALPPLPPDPLAAPLHRIVLPILLGLVFAAHLGGAVKAIARMAR
jgi:cytochrome b561